MSSARCAGANATARQKDIACRIAEAQFDLVRVRRLRSAIFADAYSPPKRIFGQATMDLVEGLVQRAKKGNPNFELPKLLKDPIYPLDGTKKIAAKLSEMTGKLAALDRYERRALSRRKFAIREFDMEGQSSPMA